MNTIGVIQVEDLGKGVLKDMNGKYYESVDGHFIEDKEGNVYEPVKYDSDDNVVAIHKQGRLGNMCAEDERILSYLRVCHTNTLDSYFIHCSKHSKDDLLSRRSSEVETWVAKNGGYFEKRSEKLIMDDRKGFIVRIVFPCYIKRDRDMESIMSTLY